MMAVFFSQGGTQGLTHSNNTETATVNFTWTAPNQSMGEVRFKWVLPVT